MALGDDVPLSVGIGRVFGAPDVDGGHVADVDVGAHAEGMGNAGRTREERPDGLESKVQARGIGRDVHGWACDDAWVDRGDRERGLFVRGGWFISGSNFL